MGFWDEFKDFLKEYKVPSIAIAFLLSGAVNDLAKSFVINIFMPLFDPLIPNETWETAVLEIGKANLKWGLFMGSFVHFAIMSLFVFFFVKKMIPNSRKIIITSKKHKRELFAKAKQNMALINDKLDDFLDDDE